MIDTKVFFRREEQEWEVIDENIRRQIVGYDSTMMMVNVHFKNGGIGPIHNHIQTQSTFIAEGTFEVTVDGVMKILQKGDSFFISSNIQHGVKCLEEGMLIDVFSPMREDFIK